MSIGGLTLRTERRERASLLVRVLVPVVAVVGALAVGGLVLAIEGEEIPPPWSVYWTGLRGSFGSPFAIVSTIAEAVPLALTAAAAALAFRASLVNLGAEGQLILGAIGAAAVGLQLGDSLSGGIVIPLALVVGALAGAGWALLAAIPRARWGTNEILPTLMLNFVALNIMNYLIFGSTSLFRDDVVSTFPAGKDLPQAARLPEITDRLDVSVMIAFAAILVLAAVLVGTRWGFRIRVVGDSAGAARYAGISLPRTVVSVFGVSGALAGLAGALLVAGRIGALEPRSLAVGLGYVGLVVAVLSRFSLVATIPVAVLIAAFETAGPAIQGAGVPESLVLMIEGLILFFVALGEFGLRYRVRFQLGKRRSIRPANVGTTS